MRNNSPTNGEQRRHSRKKASGHGRFGGDSAWKHRSYESDWEVEGREAKKLRQEPITLDASEALAEARAEIHDREMMSLLATQKVVAASYDPRYGLQIYCERATPHVTHVSAPAAKAKKLRQRKQPHNNQQRLAIAA